MLCNGCGNTTATRIRISESYEVCDSCGGLGSLSVPDVFFDKPYLDPHLVDVKKPEQKDGVWIESRRHKAEVMRTLGVREFGDRRGGARLECGRLQARAKEQGA